MARSVVITVKRLALGLACILALLGCASEMAPTSSKRTPLTLKAGQEVSLMLLTPLESGGSRVGDTAIFVVESDVMVDGRIAIPQGTQVKALVTASRSAGALSSMLNEPARLSVEFEPIAIGSASIAVKSPDSEGTAKHVFTRENTGVQANSALAEALRDEEKTDALSALADLVESASAEGSSLDDRRMRQLVDELNLQKVRSMLNASDSADKNSDQIAGIIRALRTGAALSTGDIGLALGAIEELGGIAGEVKGTLKGIFKGRNIRAHVGTKVRMLIASDVTIP